MTGFAGLDTEAFIRDHWQRAPLLIRGAVPGFEDPLSPEELAGLALEEGVEARVVVERSTGPAAGHQANWELHTGPFTETSFDHADPWTLLVQCVDHDVPGVTELKQLINFLPGWRFDDIMVSYADTGGGVGPHYDNYDVFLVQGLGKRRWRLGQHCDGTEPLMPGTDLRILEHFEPVSEFLLEPGDVLYVPPRVAHWGVAEEPSMTYSLGFRAPPIGAVTSRYVDAVLERIDPEDLYRDPVPMTPARAGEITDSALEAAVSQLRAALVDARVGADWLGELVTEPGDHFPAPGSAPLPGSRVALDPASRVAWYDGKCGPVIYANGNSFSVSHSQQPLLEKLCAGDTVTVSDEAGAVDLLAALAELGCLRDG